MKQRKGEEGERGEPFRQETNKKLVFLPTHQKMLIVWLTTMLRLGLASKKMENLLLRGKGKNRNQLISKGFHIKEFCIFEISDDSNYTQERTGEFRDKSNVIFLFFPHIRHLERLESS